MDKRFFGKINIKDNAIKLMVDVDLFVSDLPIFFACSDDEDNNYLVELLDEEASKYLIVRIKTKDILLMLDGSRTIFDSLKKGDKSWVVVESEDEVNVYDVEREILPSKIPNKLLPDKDLNYPFNFHLLSNYIEELCEDIKGRYGKVSTAYRDAITIYNYLKEKGFLDTIDM